jgi:hypothetical protein
MKCNNTHAVDWSTIPLLKLDKQVLARNLDALLANSLPDEPRVHRAWVDDLPEFEGDEGLRGGAVWPAEYLKEFLTRERARRRALRNGFARFIEKQFAAEFVKEMEKSSTGVAANADL